MRHEHNDGSHDHSYTPQIIGLVESCHGQSRCDRTRYGVTLGGDINIAKIQKLTPGSVSLYYYAGRGGVVTTHWATEAILSRPKE